MVLYNKKIIAVDCEVFLSNGIVELRKISVVDFNGDELLNTFVITSGSQNIVEIQDPRMIINEVRSLLTQLFYKKIIITNRPKFLFRYIGMHVSGYKTRDIGNICISDADGNLLTTCVKSLYQKMFGKSVKGDLNDTLENARAFMDIYKRCKLWDD